jgi:hypothetical protein
VPPFVTPRTPETSVARLTNAAETTPAAAFRTPVNADGNVKEFDAIRLEVDAYEAVMFVVDAFVMIAFPRTESPVTLSPPLTEIFAPFKSARSPTEFTRMEVEVEKPAVEVEIAKRLVMPPAAPASESLEEGVVVPNPTDPEKYD